MEKEDHKIEPHSITYWESRQINIGDYESISFGATSIVKFVQINRQEKKAEISHAEISHAYPNMTDEQAFEVAKKKVSEVLNAREKTIRLQSNSNGGTSFDTLKKATDFGIVTNEELGITKVETKSDEIDDSDFDFDDEPRPAKAKVKPPVEEKKKKFITKPSGLFSKTPKPPKGLGIDPDEEIDI